MAGFLNERYCLLCHVASSDGGDGCAWMDWAESTTLCSPLGSFAIPDASSQDAFYNASVEVVIFND